MAIHLEATYAKKLGLPNFSSHQYMVTLRVELADVSQIEAESAKLYRVLQDAVDREIVEVGYMPDATVYGMDNRPAQNGNGNGQRHNGNGHQANGNANGQHRNGSNGGDHWGCTPGQSAFFKRIVSENNLNKNEVEQMSQQLFGVGARQCNKMQMAQLIDDLLEQTGQGNRRQRFTGRQPANRS